MPLFFWIVDNEAVFALRRITDLGDVEVGFRTSDKALVDALSDIFVRYIEMGNQYRLASLNSAATAEPTAAGQ